MVLFRSVAKMPDTGEYHRDTAVVGRGNDLGVAHAAAGLNDRDRSVVGNHIETVANARASP